MTLFFFNDDRVDSSLKYLGSLFNIWSSKKRLAGITPLSSNNSIKCQIWIT